MNIREKIFYFAFIQARLNYCSIVWGKCAPSNLKPLHSLQKRAIKLISSVKLINTPVSDIFRHLQILPLHLGLRFNTLTFMHKIVYDVFPGYLKAMFSFQRQYGSNRAVIPKPNIDLFKTSFSFNGSKEWNAVPAVYRSITRLSTFKTEVKRLLFDTSD